MINTRNMLAAGVVLVLATASVISSSDSDFILSPGFKRRTEIGYIRDEENEWDEKCEKHIYRNKKPNHIATLTDNFKGAIKLKVDSENPNPVIIIRSVNEILKGKEGELNKRLHICQDYESNTGEVFLSYELGEIIPAETYLVWIGDTNKDESATTYKIVVTEEQDFQ